MRVLRLEITNKILRYFQTCLTCRTNYLLSIVMVTGVARYHGTVVAWRACLHGTTSHVEKLQNVNRLLASHKRYIGEKPLEFSLSCFLLRGRL